MHLDVVPAQIDDPTRRVGEIVPEVSEVTVSGPKRLVDNVARVVLPVDIGDRSDDFTADFVPVALDAAGQPIPEVAILPSRVTTAVKVDQRGRSVPVLVQTVGSPAARVTRSSAAWPTRRRCCSTVRTRSWPISSRSSRRRSTSMAPLRP